MQKQNKTLNEAKTVQGLPGSAFICLGQCAYTFAYLVSGSCFILFFVIFFLCWRFSLSVVPQVYFLRHFFHFGDLGPFLWRLQRWIWVKSYPATKKLTEKFFERKLNKHNSLNSQFTDMSNQRCTNSQKYYLTKHISLEVHAEKSTVVVVSCSIRHIQNKYRFCSKVLIDSIHLFFTFALVNSAVDAFEWVCDKNVLPPAAYACGNYLNKCKQLFFYQNV